MKYVFRILIALILGLIYCVYWLAYLVWECKFTPITLELFVITAYKRIMME